MPTKLGASRLLLVGLCAAILVIAFVMGGHGTQSVDVRSYVEMMLGILHTGLPRVENGPAGDLPGLEVPWNIVVDGKLWGTYPPLYPYVAAPFLAFGLHAVSVFTYALLAPLAVVTYAIAQRVLVRPVYSAMAATTAIFATPIAGNAFGLAPYPLAMLLVASTVLCVLRASEAKGKRRLALGALVGVLSALASAAHLLCFPMGLAAVASLAIVDAASPDETRGPAFLRSARSFWPSVDSLRCMMAAIAGLVVTLAPLGLLNRLRFGSCNPFTYGPARWRYHEWMVDMKIGAHLRFAAVPLVVGMLATAAWLFAGRLRMRWPVRALLVTLVAALLASNATLLDRSWRLARVFFVYVFDTAWPDLDWVYTRAPGGFANTAGGWVLKSTLQATPVLALVLALPRLALRRRHQLVALLLPGAALFAALTLRANLEIGTAIGTSWVSMRYTLPALPLLTVASYVVVEEVAPSKGSWLFAALVGATMCAFLFVDEKDDAEHGWLRQVLLLRITLAVALCATLSAMLVRKRPEVSRFAGTAVALVVTTSFAVGIGHDFRCSLSTKNYADWRADASGALLPARFGLFGKAWAMDQILALKASRDIQYADDSLVPQPTDVRPLLDHWAREGRPVYYVQTFQDPAPVSPWPDLAFERLDPVQPIWKVQRDPMIRSQRAPE